MPAPEELLSAGAMLSLDQELRNDRTADTVSARVYRHPALRDRPVVRLTTTLRPVMTSRWSFWGSKRRQ